MNEKQEVLIESDETLLKLFANSKDKMALEVLFGRHMASAYHLAFKYMGNEADAEDAVQKAFINVMRFAKDQNQPGMVKAWIMRTVVNVCKDEIKHIVRERHRLQDKFSKPIAEVPDLDIDTDEIRKILVSAIEQLPEHFRIPIWLLHYEDMSIKEVSVSLGKPEKTIRTQIARGIEKLKLSLEGKTKEFNTINIMAILSECKKNEVVPTLLSEKIKEIFNMTKSDIVFSQNAKSKTIFSLNFKALIFVVSLLGVFTFYWLKNEGEKNKETQNKSNLIIINNKSDKTNLKTDLFFDFTSTKLPEWFSIKSINTTLVSEDSEHGQAIKINNVEFLLKFNISFIKKPFKISYDLKPEKTGFRIYSPIYDSEGLVTFLISPLNNYSIGKWNHIEIYVQENATSFWNNGSLKIVHVSLNKKDVEACISLSSFVGCVDNISISENTGNKFIDLMPCVKIAEQLKITPGIEGIEIDSPFPEFNKGKINVKKQMTK